MPLHQFCENLFKKFIFLSYSLREKCPYSELFSSAFSRIRTKYGEILRISPYSIQMRGNTDQNNSEHGHFSRSDSLFYSFSLSKRSDKRSVNVTSQQGGLKVH